MPAVDVTRVSQQDLGNFLYTNIYGDRRRFSGFTISKIPRFPCRFRDFSKKKISSPVYGISSSFLCSSRLGVAYTRIFGVSRTTARPRISDKIAINFFYQYLPLRTLQQCFRLERKVDRLVKCKSTTIKLYLCSTMLCEAY